MKRLLLFILISGVGYHLSYAQMIGICYYKHIKSVTKDRKEQAGNEKGQFITFNEKGCYDSDESGFTVNNGFLKLEEKTSERVYYAGESYWGKATYIFTENYGRLNIVVEESGITHVYVSAAPPANVHTCALIKEKKPDATPVNPYSTINPVTPVTGVSNNQGGTTLVEKRTTCTFCNGMGKVHSDDVTCFSSKDKWCEGCQRMVSCSHCHLCRTCPSCSGKGYQVKLEYKYNP